MFFKVQHEPLANGLLAVLGAEGTQTLLALATYIDKDGKCYPTQDQLAELVGVSRTTLNKRINALCDVQYEGEYVVLKEQVRYKGNFSNNVYTVNPRILSIF